MRKAKTKLLSLVISALLLLCTVMAGSMSAFTVSQAYADMTQTELEELLADGYCRWCQYNEITFEYVSATCTRGGGKRVYCGYCNNEYGVITSSSALGHNYVWKVTSTTTESYQCTRCNNVSNTRTHTHSYVDYVCSGCGAEDPNKPIEHTHSYELTVYPATCIEQGYTHYYCECGESYNDNYTEIDPTNHYIFVDHYCSACGAPDIQVCRHYFVNNVCTICYNSYSDCWAFDARIEYNNGYFDGYADKGDLLENEIEEIYDEGYNDGYKYGLSQTPYSKDIYDKGYADGKADSVTAVPKIEANRGLFIGLIVSCAVTLFTILIAVFVVKNR